MRVLGGHVHRRHGASVAFEPADALARGQVPQPDHMVRARAEDEAAGGYGVYGPDEPAHASDVETADETSGGRLPYGHALCGVEGALR